MLGRTASAQLFETAGEIDGTLTGLTQLIDAAISRPPAERNEGFAG